MENLLEKYDTQQAAELCERIIRETKQDLEDRREWDDKVEVWTKLWAMEPPEGDGPWPGSANVVLPMVASACEQFHGRAYASNFDQPTPELVRCRPVSLNDVERAMRVEQLMNWQLLAQVEEFEPEHDRLLASLPKDGVAWKKWWWDAERSRPCCMFVPAVDVIVPYNTRPYQAHRGRITHRYKRSPEWVQERIKAGYFHSTDADLAKKVKDAKSIGGKDESIIGGSQSDQSDSDFTSPAEQAMDSIIGHEPVDVDTHLQTFYERHEVIRLPNGDEIDAIVYVDATDERVYRIEDRADGDNVVHQFIDYHFIWNPSGFYSFGFGHFIGPLNEIANTVFNQYIDAAKVSNLPFVFYTPGAGLRKKTIELAPGDAVPVRDVSQIKIEKMAGLDGSLAQLLQLLGLYQSDISDNTEEARGRVQKGVREPTVRGQNARLEQTLLGFGVKIRRMVSSLRREFQLLYNLDSLFMEPGLEHRILGDSELLAFNRLDEKDFGLKLDIVPTASPAFTSRTQLRTDMLELTDALTKMPNALAPRADGTVRLEALADEMLRRLLRSFGLGDLADYVPAPPAPPKTPGAEHQAWLEGEVPDLSEAEDMLDHMQKHRHWVMAYGHQLDEDTMAKVLMHIDKTQMALATKMNAQMQPPVPFAKGVQTMGGEQEQPTDFAGQPAMGAA